MKSQRRKETTKEIRERGNDIKMFRLHLSSTMFKTGGIILGGFNGQKRLYAQYLKRKLSKLIYICGFNCQVNVQETSGIRGFWPPLTLEETAPKKCDNYGCHLQKKKKIKKIQK